MERALGLVASGMFLLGSMLVFIILYWRGSTDWTRLVPASFGALMGIGYITYTLPIFELKKPH